MNVFNLFSLENRTVEEFSINNPEEFKKKLRELEEETKNDEEIYGPSIAAIRLDGQEQEFKEFLNFIDYCRVEIGVMFFKDTDGSFLSYKKRTDVLQGSEIISFFEKAINGTFRAPFQKGRVSFLEIPFSVEYRQSKGKKFAHLMIEGGKIKNGGLVFPTAKYDLFVRE